MCIFCKIIEGEIPSKKVYEDNQVVAFLDISQATLGHTLIVPKKHVACFSECDDALLAHLITVTKKLAIDIQAKLHADGCNILTNEKEAAGQSVPHLHFHILPRYQGKDDLVIEFHEHQVDLAKLHQQLTD